MEYLYIIKTEGVHDKEFALWFIAKGCTLDEANCFADETIREIEFAKDYEVYQEERLGNLTSSSLAEFLTSENHLSTKKLFSKGW